MQQKPFRKQHNSAAGCGNREQTCALKRQSAAQKECQRTRDGRLRGLNDCRKGNDRRKRLVIGFRMSVSGSVRIRKLMPAMIAM